MDSRTRQHQEMFDAQEAARQRRIQQLKFEERVKALQEDRRKREAEQAEQMEHRSRVEKCMRFFREQE